MDHASNHRKENHDLYKQNNFFYIIHDTNEMRAARKYNSISKKYVKTDVGLLQNNDYETNSDLQGEYIVVMPDKRSRFEMLKSYDDEDEGFTRILGLE